MGQLNEPDYPDTLPVFPLTGVLLLPGGNLPLNIFEPRYLAMVDDALRTNRLIGMIQPDASKAEGQHGPALYRTGCAGRITAFQELEDGRYLMTLTGKKRFEVKDELDTIRGYRRVRPDWSTFQDVPGKPNLCIDIDREKLHALLKSYFHKEGMACEWELLAATPDQYLITTLAMICPFEPQDKQALLEATDCKARGALFMELLDMAIKGCDGKCSSTH
jgi:hypothetical protein